MIDAAKYHAYGNDFLVLRAGAISPGQEAALSRAICDPHFGVGADGSVFLETDHSVAFGFRIFNQDGSEAGMSGNGLRCAAAFLHHRGIARSEEVIFETAVGRRSVRLLDSQYPIWTCRAAMGPARFRPSEIPMRVTSNRDRVLDYPLQVGERTVAVNAVWVGNPQCVVFPEGPLGDGDFEILGRGLATHPDFPEGTNVSFVEVLNRSAVRARIWERGVGPTHSSGTGCCGAAVAALVRGCVDSPVRVETETGSQEVQWRAGGEIFLTGQAAFIAEIRFEWQEPQ